MTHRLVIGLCGVAGSGKSTAARVLARDHGFARRPFAYPLKSMLATLGFDRGVLDGPSAAKELPLDIFGGRSLREAMQTLGTEWGRHQFGEDFWVRLWMRGVDALGAVVVDDVRFANEADAIRRMGGLVIRIDRDGAGSRVAPSHASEQIAAIRCNAIIPNNGTEAELAERLAGVVALAQKEQAA